MLKLLMTLITFASICLADVNFYNFLKRNYEKNEKLKVGNIKTNKIQKLQNGFDAYFVTLDINFKPLNRKISKKDIIFVNNDLIVTEIFDTKTKISLRNKLLGEKMSINLRNFKRDAIHENDQNCY
ncbi:hypothetical protein [Campylobacter pinnipediorum]|uniref:hypothetical protein n=1 Tax=Campylobacter pinnipediorum TaxID=1965231 RepID=UPI0012FFB50C|nr:hypothetical protein [Campylobacter pinnipediorum]